MSTIKLLPEDGGEAIVVAEKQTVIGRGPFLKVVDKRVSRNHAILEVTDGKLSLTPVHTNPCFFRRGSKGTQEILQRDVQQPLEDGDMFGLLPDQLFYTVCYGDTAVNSVKRNGENKEAVKKETVQQASPVKKGRGGGPRIKEDPEEEETDIKQRKVSFRDTVCADGRKMALPLTKTRPLPAWMVRLSNANAPAAKKKAAPARTTAPAAKRAAPAKAAPKKKAADVDFLDDEEEEDDKPAKRRGQKAKSYADDDDDDYEDDDYEDVSPKKRKVTTKQQKRRAESDEEFGATAPRGRGRNSRGRRQDDSDDGSARRPKRAATKNVGSYGGLHTGDEFEDSDRGMDVKGDSDSDFKMDANDDGDSGSDWGKRPVSPKKQARKPAARSSARKGRKRKTRRAPTLRRRGF